MAFCAPPERHWRSYGTEPLPTPAEALDQPLLAFSSWSLRVTCDRCGQIRTLEAARVSERQRDMPIRVLIARMRLKAAADGWPEQSC
jgi:hypothetical protein